MNKTLTFRVLQRVISLPQLFQPTRSTKLYNRTSVETYTGPEYEEYLRQKQNPSRRVKNTIKNEKLANFREELPPPLEKLKFRKISNETRNLFRKMINNVKSSSYRENHNVCLLRGKNLIREAMIAGGFIRTIYFSELKLLEKLPIDIVQKTNLVHVPIAAMREMSDERTDGLFALATQQDAKTRQKIRTQRIESVKQKESTILPVTLICEGIKDPKIMGDILKVASCVGCEEVYVMDGCVSIWNTSVLKRGGGAHFKLPILPNQQWENVEKLVSNSKPDAVFLSHNCEEGLTIIDFKQDPVVVAINKGSSVLDTLKRESTVKLDNKEDRIKNAHIPSINFDQANWPTKQSVLVVGSISFGAYSFAVNLQETVEQCHVINLPLSRKTESLSPSIEASVLLFDALRQIGKNKNLE
nr:rRNA methyltransferase 3, mitochondrial [Ciona intestinalis]|eukprot:XP_002120809.3 rRNA methyltransferase 3, mitochondrial [Ciona intestinalis]